MTWLGSLSEDCFAALPAGSETRQSKVLCTRVRSVSVNHCRLSRGPFTFPRRTAGADDERRMHQEVLCHVFHLSTRVKVTSSPWWVHDLYTLFLPVLYLYVLDQRRIIQKRLMQTKKNETLCLNGFPNLQNLLRSFTKQIVTLGTFDQTIPR